MEYATANDYANQGLRYDLRQQWAMLLGKQLEKIFEVREDANFPEWLRLMKNLHDDIQYKFKKTDHDEFKDLMKSIIFVIQRNEYAYIDKRATPRQRGEISDALSKLHTFLITMMDKHKFFGAPEEVEGL